ncbi:MAG: heme/hemin ABC transporter substrate-binding protein [Leucobacter sp.]
MLSSSTSRASRASRTSRTSRTRAAIALALGLAVSLTGCQIAGSEDTTIESTAVELPPLSTLTPLDNPRTFEGETTALVGTPSIAPLTDTPPPSLPTVVQSKDRAGDVEVEVTDTSRVLAISLTGTLNDIIYTLGLSDQLVGRDATTEFPGAEELPLVVGAGHDIEAESVLGLEPTLILTDLSIGGIDFVNTMRSAGIPVVVVDRSVDPETSAEATRQIASALGVAAAADELNAAVDTAIAAKEKEVSELIPTDESNLPRVAFLYVRGGAGIFYLFGEGSGIDSLLSSVGVVDVAEEAGWVGQRPMTDEALISMNPDIIVVMTKGLESTNGVDGLLEAQPSIALTAAGQHRRIIDIDDAKLFASGPRIPDVVDALARAIYAPDSLE